NRRFSRRAPSPCCILIHPNLQCCSSPHKDRPLRERTGKIHRLLVRSPLGLYSRSFCAIGTLADPPDLHPPSPRDLRFFVSYRKPHSYDQRVRQTVNLVYERLDSLALDRVYLEALFDSVLPKVRISNRSVESLPQHSDSWLRNSGSRKYRS